MSDREKLIELMVEARGICLASDCTKCDYNANTAMCDYTLAIDHLISNGVTVHKWIPVSERLPEHGDVVLCYMSFDEQRILQWDECAAWWNGYGEDHEKNEVTHWMPLPEPPKECE